MEVRMKAKCACNLLFFCSLAVLYPRVQYAQAKLDFVSPRFESPDYLVHFPLEVKDDKLLITDIQINGLSASHIVVLKGTKPADLAKPLDPGLYDVKLHYAWKGNASYRVTLFRKPEHSEKIEQSEWSGVAPKDGGIPDLCQEGFYRVCRIEEEAGLERKGEIAYLTITAPKSEMGQPLFNLYDGKERIPFQIIDQKESTPPENSAKTHPVTLTYKLAVSLKARPYDKKIITAFKGQAAAVPEQGFILNGDGLGKSVKTTRLALQFHTQSGQINTIEYLREGIKLFNKAGVIHWNPDVFIPGTAWDHSYDWKPPEMFEEKQGAFVYINARKGPLPHIQNVVLEVKYTLEKDAPYFISETRMNVEKDLGVIALRNDEMVLYKELFDSLMYRDKRGAIIKLPMKEMAGMPYGLVHTAPADLGWVGLLNTKENYGFFSLRVAAANSNLDASGDFLHKAGTYFYAPSDGEYVYWVRPLLYTWADFTTNNQLTFLPKGSSFYEKNAYILLKLDQNTPAALDTLLKMLRNPLRVF
jgi:hypothetical protein